MTIDPGALESIRSSGGTWAAYQNKVWDSSHFAHLLYLQYGKGRTFEVPPKHAPDGPHGTGWKYIFLGLVDLEKGEINECPFVEFVCCRKHITEKILSAAEDQKIKKISCPHVMSKIKNIPCGEPAQRIELSQTAPPVLVAGVGGFHSPSKP